METPQNTPPQDSPVPNHLVDDDEINLLELLLVLVKNKFMILGSMVVTFVLACGVTLLMPNVYTSTARILPPPQEKGGLGAMLSGMGDLAALAGLSAGGSSGDLFVAMLQSRTVADAIIDQFDLMTVYDQKYRAEMYGKLNKLVSISLGKRDGVISISVDDEDPDRAAAIANAYVEELKTLNVRLNLSNAGRERVFLEERLAVVQADLVRAEDNLREFQETHKAIKLDTQATAIIEAISRLRGELASKEVELGVLLSFQTEQNPEVKNMREGIAQLKRQLRQLEESPAGSKIADDIFIATSNVPDLGIQYARFLRDYKVQETLFELLTKQYEVAKINEAKNTSSLQVLDEGAVPDKKSKPKRSMIVLAATFAVGFCAVLFAFVRGHLSQLKDEDLRRLSKIRDSLRIG